MKKFSLPNEFDHNGFLRHFLAVEMPDVFPPSVWLTPITALFAELTVDDVEMLKIFLGRARAIDPSRRSAFVGLERKLRSLPQFDALDAALRSFEESYFCKAENGSCPVCGRPEDIGGPLCLARFGTGVVETVDAKIEATEGHALTETEAALPAPVADPLLDFFKIPSEPGEINGFEFDAMIDSSPVIVWRPACEIETDFVEDILGEAAAAGVSRVFLIARTEIGPEMLPMHQSVALILLAIPPTFDVPSPHVIEADEVIYS